MKKEPQYRELLYLSIYIFPKTKENPATANSRVFRLIGLCLFFSLYINNRHEIRFLLFDFLAILSHKQEVNEVHR